MTKAPHQTGGAPPVLLALALPVSQPLVQRLPSHPRSQRHRTLTLPAPHRSHRRSPTPILNLSQRLTNLLNLTTQPIQLHQARDIISAHRYSFQVRPARRSSERRTETGVERGQCWSAERQRACCPGSAGTHPGHPQ
nr:MAG TPA: hypothetical protein [Caudoviricetes sp.]